MIVFTFGKTFILFILFTLLGIISAEIYIKKNNKFIKILTGIASSLSTYFFITLILIALNALF